LRDRPFQEPWGDKWRVLDDSFLFMEKALADLGKRIGSVIIDLMAAKLPFGPETVFEDSKRTASTVTGDCPEGTEN
jgi:hypothetical protein